MRMPFVLIGVVFFFSSMLMAGPVSPKGKPDHRPLDSQPSETPDTSSTKPASTQPVVERVKTHKLRVASYNIERGDQFEKVQANLERTKADLILLQEVPLRTLQKFAKRLGMNYQFGPYLPDGDFGMGVLAKGKLDAVKLFSMENERNFALAVKFKPRDKSNLPVGRTILVVCTHLKSLQRPVTTGLMNAMKPHTIQAKKILAEVKKQKLPTIVAGDFNTLSWTPEYRVMTASMKDVAVIARAQHQPTIFVGGGGYRIDYFFINQPWEVRDYEVSPRPGSDHRMIQAVLELPLVDQRPKEEFPPSRERP